jgi:two-component sensor histidine kinase
MAEGDVCVLYVDDDPGLARLVQKVLHRRGFVVEHSPTAAAALERLKQGGIDAIGLDHHMPGGTGLDFLDQLASVDDAPPVVYVTGSGDLRVAVAALKAGAADYVPKDTGEEFFELLHSALTGAVMQAKLARETAAAERDVREARDRAEMLLREVNHRVGNSLALVAALVRLQASAVTDPGARAALMETQARISAIASIHRRLYTSNDVRTVDAGSYITNLIQELQTAMQDVGQPHPIRLDVAPVQVPTDKAVSVGVVVTELITNAYKYAYPNGAPGEIRVALRQIGDNEVCLSVEDDGIGWSGTGTPSGTGVGSRIVKAMATNLKSEVVYEKRDPGTLIVMKFAL